MPVSPQTGRLPGGFGRAVATLGLASLRPEVAVSETRAPQRLAPYAVALHGEAKVGGEELASGRFVVLHDPAGPDGWAGTTRLVTYVRAPMDVEVAHDPLLPAVGWSWLTDALDTAGARYTAAGGTVTRVSSERFGVLAGQPPATEVEIRAAWSPLADDLATHLVAFAELLCAAAGLPPGAPGVVAMPRAGSREGIARRRRG